MIIGTNQIHHRQHRVGRRRQPTDHHPGLQMQPTKLFESFIFFWYQLTLIFPIQAPSFLKHQHLRQEAFRMTARGGRNDLPQRRIWFSPLVLEATFFRPPLHLPDL